MPSLKNVKDNEVCHSQQQSWDPPHEQSRLLYRMTIFLCSPSLFPCIQCSSGYLGWCQNQWSKAQGHRELSTDFWRPKDTYGKYGITLFTRIHTNRTSCSEENSNGMQEKIVDSEDSNTLEKVAQKNDRIYYCKYQSLNLTGPWITSGKALLLTAVWTLWSDFSSTPCRTLPTLHKFGPGNGALCDLLKST